MEQICQWLILTSKEQVDVPKGGRICKAYNNLHSISIILLMLQVKNIQEQCKHKAIMLLLDYMDYWLPLLLFITLPLWILPALFYYSTWRMVQMWKCCLRMGNKLIHTDTPSELSYAILRGNGKYLREQGPDVHKKQFYDYTSRRFMSIGEFQPEAKILELECDSTIGLQFFAETLSSGTVVGLQSSCQILRSVNNSLGLIAPTDYSITGQPVGYDCVLLFNFKSKVKASGGKVDLMSLLRYCRFHMDREGYLVFGDYFEEGELATFIAIFEGFKFKVAQQQQITKNIEYARKLANRKNLSFEQKIFDAISTRMEYIFGKRQDQVEKEFIVLILQKTQ